MIMLLALLLAAAPEAPADDTLDLARSGKLQCYRPDVARHRCGAIAYYAFSDDGEIDNLAEVLLNPSPLVVMRTEDPVTFRDGAICGTPGDLTNAVITIDGQPASAETAAVIVPQILAARQKLGLDQEVCTIYVPDGDQLSAVATVGGVARPDLTQTVIWIDAGEGYEVGP